jgi:CRISPR-associated endonuclease Csn1
MLRRSWGLNSLLPDHNFAGGADQPKNRLDHRHHAIDAIVIACTSRATIQRLATASAKAEEREAERVVARTETPWSTFREDVRTAVGAIVVSHKPDHGTVSREGYARGRGQTAGKLHNDTAYGQTDDKDEKGNAHVVRRIPITGIKSAADLKKIRVNAHGHSELLDRLAAATFGLEGKTFEQAVVDFVKGDAKFKGLRHVRITEVENPIWVTHGDGRHKKGYLPGGNDRFDVWELPDGKWDAEVVTTFDAHRPDFVPRMRRDNHNARKIMSLKKGDMVAYNDPDSGERVIAIVRKFDQRGKQLYLDAHNEAGNLDKREKEGTYKPLRPRPNPLKQYRPRQVRLDEIGQVFDPGPWWDRQPD